MQHTNFEFQLYKLDFSVPESCWVVKRLADCETNISWINPAIWLSQTEPQRKCTLRIPSACSLSFFGVVALFVLDVEGTRPQVDTRDQCVWFSCIFCTQKCDWQPRRMALLLHAVCWQVHAIKDTAYIRMEESAGLCALPCRLDFREMWQFCAQARLLHAPTGFHSSVTYGYSYLPHHIATTRRWCGCRNTESTFDGAEFRPKIDCCHQDPTQLECHRIHPRFVAGHLAFFYFDYHNFFFLYILYFCTYSSTWVHCVTTHVRIWVPVSIYL